MEGTFGIDDYLGRVGTGNAKTIDYYRRRLMDMEGRLGKRLEDASQRDLMALKDQLRAMKSGHWYAQLLRSFYKKAGRPELAEICSIKQRRARLGPDDILTLDEVQAMISKADSLLERAFLGCLWETGVRVSEVLALRRKHVKVGEGPENGNRRVYGLWFGKVKETGLEHTGYVVETAGLMESWLAAHPTPLDDAYLFPSWHGGPMDRTSAFRMVKRIAAKAGIQKRIFPHLFRHSRTTHLMRLGVPMPEIKMLLGWKPDSPVPEALYAHLASSDAKKALLRAHGADIAKVDLGKLSFSDETLKPVKPMNPPPKSVALLQRATEGAISEALSKLATRPEFQRLMAEALAQTVAPGPTPSPRTETGPDSA